MKHLPVIPCHRLSGRGLVFLGWAQMTDGHAAIKQWPLSSSHENYQADSSAIRCQSLWQTAVVRVNHAQVTVLIASNGAKYIKKMTVADRA